MLIKDRGKKVAYKVFMDYGKLNTLRLNEILNSEILNIHLETRGILNEISKLDRPIDTYVGNYKDNPLMRAKFNSSHDQLKSVLHRVLSDSTLSRELFDTDSLREQRMYTGKLINQRQKVCEFKRSFDCLQRELGEKNAIIR
jgi:hypothetical protein